MNTKELSVRNQLRSLSRRIVQNPSSLVLHQERVGVALAVSGNEPIQGTLADFFYGCWYEVPFHASALLEKSRQHLRPSAYQIFLNLIEKKGYLSHINELATGWSVLVIPSMRVPSYRLRTNRDYSLNKADIVITALLEAKTARNEVLVAKIEHDFFSHCMVCHDSMAFMQVWFKLHKLGWNFDDNWEKHRQKIELFPKK